MRAGLKRSFVAAVSAAGLVACGRFGTETPSDAPAAEDAGPDARADDAAAPADPFAAVVYGKFDGFDDRPDLPTGGQMQWTETRPRDISITPCTEPPTCSGNTVRLVSDDGTTSLETSLDPATRVLRFDFALRIASFDSTKPGQAQLASIAITNTRFLIFEIVDGKLGLADQQGENTDSVSLGAATFDKWSTYELYIDLDQKIMAVSRDGVPFAPAKHLRDLIVAPPFSLISARIGLTYVRGDNDFTLEFDNIGIREFPHR